MRVLVDTCVWSKVLRAEKPDEHLLDRLREFILGRQVVLIGPILQELLSGVRSRKEFVVLRERLEPFDSLELNEEIYVKAAEYYNLCKAHGINGGHMDFLICAASIHHGCALMTIDDDFKMFERYLPVKVLAL